MEINNPHTYSYSYAQTPPAFGTEVTVPANVKERFVFASISLASGVSIASSVNGQVETGIGTGVYETVARWRSPSAIAGTVTNEGTFAVPRGRRYKFMEDEVGGTRSIAVYGFRDELD